MILPPRHDLLGASGHVIFGYADCKVGNTHGEQFPCGVAAHPAISFIDFPEAPPQVQHPETVRGGLENGSVPFLALPLLGARDRKKQPGHSHHPEKHLHREQTEGGIPPSQRKGTDACRRATDSDHGNHAHKHRNAAQAIPEGRPDDKNQQQIGANFNGSTPKIFSESSHSVKKAGLHL